MVTCWNFYFRLFAGIIRTASAEFLEQPAASHIPGKFGGAGWIMEPSQPGWYGTLSGKSKDGCGGVSSGVRSELNPMEYLWGIGRSTSCRI